MGAGPSALISVGGKSLDAYERDDVSGAGEPTGNIRRYQRAVSNKEEQKAVMSSYQVEHVVAQQRLSTGEDNGMYAQVFRFGEKLIEFVCG
jgi:hypothetical protein